MRVPLKALDLLNQETIRYELTWPQGRGNQNAPWHFDQINTAFDPKALAAQTGSPVGHWMVEI